MLPGADELLGMAELVKAASADCSSCDSCSFAKTIRLGRQGAGRESRVPDEQKEGGTVLLIFLNQKPVVDWNLFG